MKNSLLILTTFLLFTSCAKEQFATNKGNQVASGEALTTTSAVACAQSTLISPKVDILMLWDNTSSFNFVTSETKASMTSLISSVSENFDYHILSVPLVPANSSNLYESQLVAKNNTNLSGNALSILKPKDSAVASLSFSQGMGSAETGVDRATSVIEQNRSNGIFRNGAYTIIVIISNEDDKGCSLPNPVTNPTGALCNNNYDKDAYLAPRIKKLLCMRGNTVEDCSSTGYSNATSLNSTMMRFINISPLTYCANGNNLTNYSYKKVAKTLYETSYTNGWPTSNDDIRQNGAPDSYDLCSISFGHIFDGVNTAIKQTLLKHRYEYWPVAAPGAVFDPDTIRVTRSDGKILGNRKSNPSITDGYELITDNSGNPQTVTMNTRYFPTSGEPFTGKMIQLFGAEGDDKLVYPDCLTISFDGVKSTYGYVYLNYGAANISTIQVYKSINGSAYTAIPQSSSNGWDYMGLQNTAALDSNLKVLSLPPGTPSGYFIRLNGSYKFQNSTTTTTSIRVDYNSQTQSN
jgi:hypothetical protein